jgi:AhpD family alkylhydroperoxidase
VVSLLARATRRASLDHFRHVTPVTARDATGLVAAVYHQIEAEFGMLAPPLALHAAAPETLAGCWLILREVMLVPALVDRPSKEAVAAAVSLANSCPYCVEVHGATLIGLLRGPDAHAIVADRVSQVSDLRLRALARWARSSGSGEEFRHMPPFPLTLAPELIGAAITFHYINRMVNIFLHASPLPPVPAPALAVVRRGAARLLGRLARVDLEPGRALDLLPAASLPPDLFWAAGQPHIAAALARAVAAIDRGGDRSVPEPVQHLVRQHLSDQPDTAQGIGSRSFLNEAVAGLPAPQRPIALLALLTALSSYRVSDGLIADCRDEGCDDEALIDITSWAAMAMARRIGAELSRDLRA